jgi:glycosyltransferase involved in cell wall biosynthesis
MERAGHKIIIAAPRDTPLFLKAKAHGFKVYGIEFKRLSMIKDYKLLKTIFHNETPDIVNTHGNQDSKTALLAANSASVPCKILSHHFNAHIKTSWLNRLIYKKVSNYIFTNSDHTTDYFKGIFKFKARKIFTVPIGITPPKSLLPKREAKNILIQELDLESRARFLGVVGNLTESLDIFNLIKAFKKIEPRFPDHHLIIVGTGDKEGIVSAKNLIRDLQLNGKIHFSKTQKDIWSLLRAFDCQITPVQKKKNLLLEEMLQDIFNAMYCLCPVLISDSNELTGILDHSSTGFVFNLNDPYDLADNISQTLNNRTETEIKIQAAYDLVKKNHTIDASGNYILKLLRLLQIRSDGPERNGKWTRHDG